MPFHRLKTSKLRARLFAALLAGGALLVLGELTVAWQTMSEVNKDAQQRLQYSLTLFDRTVDHARQAAINVESMLGKPCRDTAQLLREQAAIVPDVRSVNLALGSRIYCSSLYGDYDGVFDVNSYVAGRLQLLKGNVVTPDHPLLIFRHAAGEGSVLVGVDGYYLRNILDISSKTRRWRLSLAPVPCLVADKSQGYRLQLSRAIWPSLRAVIPIRWRPG